MEGNWFPVSTLHGTVYLTVVPKENHREHIFRMLSQALGCEVSGLNLKIMPGSTRPEFPELPIDANWTHSKDICVLAYSRECRVGVDLEFHSRNRLKLADRFFSAEERDKLHQVLQDEGTPAAQGLFYTLWCRKEAFFKCRGGDFFEGTLRQPMLETSVGNVQLMDLNPTRAGIQGDCSLCIATMPLG
jgi:phosphopantetheinyl transferase